MHITAQQPDSKEIEFRRMSEEAGYRALKLRGLLPGTRAPADVFIPVMEGGQVREWEKVLSEGETCDDDFHNLLHSEGIVRVYVKLENEDALIGYFIDWVSTFLQLPKMTPEFMTVRLWIKSELPIYDHERT